MVKKYKTLQRLGPIYAAETEQLPCKELLQAQFEQLAPSFCIKEGHL